MKNILIILSLLSLSICSCNNREKLLVDYFNNVVNKELVEGEKVVLHRFEGGHLQFLIGDSLLLVHQNKKSKVLHLYNLNNSKTKYRFALKGNGPGEVNHFANIWFNSRFNSILGYDPAKKIITQFSLDSILQREDYLPQQMPLFTNEGESIYKVAPINDTLLLCSGVFNKGVFEVIDNKHDSIIGSYGEYPKSELTEGQSDHFLGTAYQGMVIGNPNGEKFVKIGYLYGGLDFARFNHNAGLDIVKSYNITPLIFQAVSFPSGYQTAAYVRSNRMGFVSVAYNSKYIYMLYSGKSPDEFKDNYLYGNAIAVFDWDGNPVAYYSLSRDAESIAVDSNNPMLYVLFVDEDYSLERFNIGI